MKIGQKLLNVYLSPLKSFFAKGHEEMVMDAIHQKSKKSRFFLSYRLKEKECQFDNRIPNMCKGDSFGILIQGPLCLDNNFTEESVKFYVKEYPDAKIILSTWNTENKELIERIKQLGVYVVLNEKPASSGVLNINYQLISTLNGIKFAKELNLEYIAKTRSDQRICRHNVFYALQNLVNVFPANSKNVKGRVIATPTYMGNMFTPYFISDFFYFAHTDDLLKMFDIGLDHRDNYKLQTATKKELSEKMYPPEIYLTKHYLSSLGQQCSDTIKEYWQCVKDYYILIDRSQIDLFTEKYNYSNKEHVNNSEYIASDDSEKKLTMIFDFANWLNLYSGSLEYKPEYEKELETKLF